MTDAETLDSANDLPTPEEGELIEDDVDEGTPENAGDDEEPNEEDENERADRLKRFKQWFLQHKKKTIPATVALLLIVIFGIPAIRYAVLGLVLKKSYVVAITDAKSNLPVSEVEVKLRGKTAKTGADGKARLNGVPVGPGQVTATKKYYTDFSAKAVVPLQSKTDFKVSLNPTGRQVPIKVVDKITGKPIAGAVLSVADTQVKTDEKGEATVVLPPEKETQEGVITNQGYNQQKVTVKVSHLAVKENTYQLVPAGKLYYLSKRTGKINVMKSDLDGSNSVVVLAATGNESEDDTVLLASRDWQYLALKSRREGQNAKLYLIEASNDKLTEIDGGDASISLVGWSGHRVIYKLERTNVKLWQPKRTALKSYDAEKKQLAVLDETDGEGSNESDYAENEIQNINILSDRLAYSLIWYAGYSGSSRLNGKKHAIVSIKPDNTSKQTLKDFDAKTTNYINAVQSEVGEIYFVAYVSSVSTFYTYKNGKVEPDGQMTDDKFNKPYPTFLVSPTSESTFWYESRDGKNTLFVGDSTGNNGKEIATLSEYTPYGWFSDNYVLVSKNSSELYVLPSNGAGTTGQILKITDYHKPSTSFYGYGYGYGGL